MRLVIVIVGLVLLIGCAKEPLAVYSDRGVVEIVPIDSTVPFSVPDEGDEGWHWYDPGVGSRDVKLKLKEKIGRPVWINSIQWDLFDIEGDRVATGVEPIVPPLEIGGGRDTTYTLILEVKEGYAQALDKADGHEDYSGKGYYRFTPSGKDVERGVDIGIVEGYLEIMVRKAD
ncbi:hypothetical protein DRP53_10410 [candidate division WOR-3 bacterium]|uniref:Lipoprotein n=1 Tax=candidate division WOR-3 bacterium TaxID=2052148 RepID=A0A660SD61_UNCW3|nr:MAG: hypothetical protein DRP53_10410 [candidate division WOR-3 bacterium]